MAGGIGPEKKLSARVRFLRFGNEVKPNSDSIPSSCFSQRLISETEPAELQVMPVQLQRFSRLVSDQEWRKEEGARLFFHFTRASPSCLVARMDSSDERKKTKRRR